MFPDQWADACVMTGRKGQKRRALLRKRARHDIRMVELTAAGAVPNTSLALTCELFRDWKSPVVPKVREAVGWYQAELQKLNAKAAA